MSQTETEAIEQAASVKFVCEDCGRVHNRNNPPCNDCGSMRLSATTETASSTPEIDEQESWRIVRDANREITGLRVFVSLVGIATLLVGAFALVSGSWIVGVTITIAGVLAIPAIRWRIEPRLDIYLSSRAVLIWYLALVGGGFVLATSL